MSTWRPIEPDEVPALRAMGEQLRTMRKAAGMTQAALGDASGLSAGHVGSVERGQSRTRRSTLDRIAAALFDDPEVARREVERLAALAGPALAPEGDWLTRQQRSRERKIRKRERAVRANLANVRRTARTAGGPTGARLLEEVADLEAEVDRITGQQR